MAADKINETGTSSNSDSLKNMDEQSGKPTDGSQAYADTDKAIAAKGTGKTASAKNHHRKTKPRK